MDKNGAEKTPQKTSQEINDEFDKRELELLERLRWLIEDAQRYYAQNMMGIRTNHDNEMSKLKADRWAALTQCAQKES